MRTTIKEEALYRTYSVLLRSENVIINNQIEWKDYGNKIELCEPLNKDHTLHHSNNRHIVQSSTDDDVWDLL